jgi:hypothetical protein
MRAIYIHLDGREYPYTVLREAGGIVFLRFTGERPPQLAEELGVLRAEG